MEPVHSWRLTVLGAPQLIRSDGRIWRLGGAGLALVAYLSLEGASSRSRLAGLLWPDTHEGAARNNLVHLIRRTMRSYGPLLHADEVVELSSAVTADVQALLQPDREGAPVPEGRLLAGVDFDDRLDLAEWLLTWRERLDEVQIRRLGERADRMEAAGEYAAALELATRLLALSPVSEDAFRRLMRLHFLGGDRGAALGVFRNCQATLHREFGTEPLPETQALAQVIGSGTAPLAPRRPRMPLNVLRPPALVGREGSWAQLEAAWDAGQLALLAGEAGVGKSRLVQDFAASRGAALHLEGRPGDALVPYATVTRSLRRILARTPDLPLAPWMRESLSRLLPELAAGPPAEAGPDTRLHAALQHVFEVGLEGVNTVVFEDLHFADRASVEAGTVLVSSSFPLGPPGRMPRMVWVVRPDELPDFAADAAGGLVRAGLATRVDIGPLDAPAVDTLLRALDIASVQDLGPQLARFTGGNPLFVLETVKHLLEFPDGDGRLPVAARVSQLIEARLARLPPAALSVARGAAVLQSDLRIELVAEVLGTPLLDTAAAWEALETAQVMVGERFSHDLVQDTVLAGVPGAVRRLLSRSAARVLGRHGAGAARVARHWLDGGEPTEAAPLLVQAAHDALRALRPPEAAAFFDEAAQLYDTLAAPEAAFAVRVNAVESLNRNEEHGALAGMIEGLQAGARTPLQRARAHWARATRLLRLGEYGPAAAAVDAGLDALPPGAEPALRAALLRERLLVTVGLGRAEAALETIQAAAALHDQLADPVAAAHAEHAFGTALLRLGRFPAAAGHYRLASARFAALGDHYGAAWSRYQLAETLEGAGQAADALALREDLEGVLGASSAAPVLRSWNLLRLSVLASRAGDYGRALACLHLASAGESSGPLWRSYAQVYWRLGALDACEQACHDALAHRDGRDWGRDLPWLLVGLVQARLGHAGAAEDAYRRVDRALEEHDFSYTRGRLLLARAELAAPHTALTLATQALDVARTEGHPDLETAALTARAEAQLALGAPAAAAQDSEAAVAHLPEHAPRDDYARPLLIHHRALNALDDPHADRPLRAALAWLEQTARTVPPEYLEAFLEQHVTHRALRELARTRR